LGYGGGQLTLRDALASVPARFSDAIAHVELRLITSVNGLMRSRHDASLAISRHGCN
jgi:hypothetical protein